MKSKYSFFCAGTLLAMLLLFPSCRASHEVTAIEGGRIPVDSVWDINPDVEALALLMPYKAKLDSTMYTVVGTAGMPMDRFRPESPLSNLVADVLRESGQIVLGHPADVAIMNIGGIRNSLAAGDITIGDVYEILPFENALCVLTMKGRVLKQLFEDLAAKHGEGVSGIQLAITENGKLLKGTVGGKPVEDERDYTVATIDYLAEGNDGLKALPLAHKRECPPDAVLRDLFMNYVKRQAATGKPVTSRTEGRIIVNQ